MTVSSAPEHNVTGLDYQERRHFRYSGPILDVHAHVLRTRPTDARDGPLGGTGPGASLEQAEQMLAAAETFGVVRTWSMCPAEDMLPLRERFGRRIAFNGAVGKKKIDDPDDEAYRQLDQYLAQGIEVIKFWSAPRGRERGLLVDAPYRVECLRRARAAGVRVVMVHVGDPDVWFQRVYTDVGKFGTKESQYVGLERMLQEFPDLAWIGAHMGGDPEHPDHLEELLERYPHLHFDTSATKWQVREVSARRDAIRGLVLRHPGRFLFGTDNVTRHGLPREHYVSRYWCQRTLWESGWRGQSPIADPDHAAPPGGPPTPLLHGLELPPEVLHQVYYTNARKLLGSGLAGTLGDGRDRTGVA